MSEPAQLLEPPSVQATLAFATDAGDKYYYEVAAPGAAGRNMGSGTARHEVTVHNARDWHERPKLDVHGFELQTDRLPPIDFLDDACVKRLYYPAMADIAQRCTGAHRIHIFDHTVRHGDPDVRRAKRLKPPARGVHNDYTHWSARKRLHDLLPIEADELLRRRFAIVQAWRPIGHPIESDPIAVADARTVDEADFVPVPRVAPGRVGETWRALYSPRQRFFYYPLMTPDEALFFKVYDSAEDGPARYTLHTAFELPDPPPDAAPRHSLEMRLFAFY